MYLIVYKLLAMPTTQVAHKLTPLAFSTGLSLLGALSPNPLFSGHYFSFSLIIVFYNISYVTFYHLRSMLHIALILL